MADNSLRTPGSGETIASDDVGGVKYQRVKLTTGADGAAVDVQPPDADGSASSRNLPAGAMVYDESLATWYRARNTTSDYGTATKYPGVGPYYYRNSDTFMYRARTAESDGISGAYMGYAGPALFNETSMDRQRGNTQVTLLASAARTTNASSGLQTNYNHRGIALSLAVTSSGTGTLQLYLVTSGGGALMTWPTTAPFTGEGVFILYPGVINADVDAEARAGVLPRNFYAGVNKSDASSWTYSLVGSLIL